MAGTSTEMEDTAEYRLFPVIPEGLDEKAVLKCLEQTQDAILAFLSQHLVDYIWQNDPFALRVVPGSGECLGMVYVIITHFERSVASIAV